MPPVEPPVPGFAGDAPLADDEIDLLFAGVADAAMIALAVSGGADSLALLDSIDRWRRRGRSKPKVIVLTVDHRLRKGSRAEAATVAKIATARGMDVRILTRQGPRPTSDVEAAARGARYRLLVEACRAVGATHLFVAHHRDDLAETFLLRLKRGAGVFGLAAMRPSLSVGDVTIVRPFLAVSRARLAATAAAAGLVPADDPMNADPRFDRVRARRLLPLLAGEGLDPAALAATALRLADAADAIDHAATGVLAEAVEADEFAVAWLKTDGLRAAPREVRLRALSRLLIAVGGEEYPPRHDRLVSLSEALLAHRGAGRFKRTLGGAVIEWRGKRFAFYRESGRESLPTLPVRPGAMITWDHRFAIALGNGAPTGVTVGPLGEPGRREIGFEAGIHPAGALAALPAVRRRGKILAVPPFATGNPGQVTGRSILADRIAQPPLFPDLAAGR